MPETTTDFIGFASRGVASLLGTILREEGLQLFRRGPQVVLGSQAIASNDFALTYTVKSANESDKGSFSYKSSDERFLVFRTPSRLTLSFTLLAKGLSRDAQAKAYDKLMTFFFDHRAVEAFVPDSLKTYAPLYDKLAGGKAELKVTEVGQAANPHQVDGDLFQFSFDYIALYHSGNPLREEVKAKTRVVELNNDHSERSVL